MAQSPAQQGRSTESARYEHGWAQLYTLLQQGHSFSGRERNCCFLNVAHHGTAQFVDISAVSGIDHADDSRAIAVTDWDLDGDQDLWFANRTSPRARLMLNSVPGGASVMIKLVGTQCNRDAIGARVEVKLVQQPNRPRVQTVHAGSGFLSQSSRWLHFGLGDSPVDSVRIRWPGQTQPEQLVGLQAGYRYTVRQGAGVVNTEPFADHGPTRRGTLVSHQPVRRESSRTVLVGRMPLPPVRYTDQTTGATLSTELIDRPTLVNVWTSSCTACLDELREWSEAAGQIADAGLDVLTLNADQAVDAEVQSSHPDQVDRAHQLFRAGSIDCQGLRRLNVFQNSVWDLQRQFVVPTTFLLDRHQRVVVIYRGRVELDQLIDDVRLIDSGAESVRQAVTEFAGIWFGSVPRPRSLSLANSLRQADLDPQQYLSHCLRIEEHTPPDDAFRLNERERADVHFALGTELLTAQRESEAVQQFQAAIAANPDHRDAYANLGAIESRAKRWKQAEARFSQALVIDPEHVNSLVNRGLARMQQNKVSLAIQDYESALHVDSQDLRAIYNLGLAMRAVGNERRAIKLFKESLKINPDLNEAKFHLAWIQITSRAQNLRDGAQAVRLATELCDATHHREPALLDLLGAALAENGDFHRAVQTLDRAIEIAATSPRDDLLQRLQARRSRYANQQSLSPVEPRK